MAGRRTAAAAGGLVGLLLLVGCGTGGTPHPDPTPSGVLAALRTASPSASSGAPGGPYVALGDSYTSGLRIDPQVGTPTGCARSSVNYPSLVARRLGVAEFTDASCSGARTGDLTAAQQTTGGANPPQLSWVTPATRLVTIGMGGNDAGFMDVLGHCAVENALRQLGRGSSADPSPCRTYYTSGAGRDELQHRLDAAGERLTAVLREIRQRAPQAKVFVVGYPELLPADPAACSTTLGRTVSAGDLGFLVEEEQQLNRVLRKVADGAGVGFVDTYAASVGHDMCAGEGGRWVEPPVPAAGLAPVHPNAAGQRGMAAAVLRALGVAQT